MGPQQIGIQRNSGVVIILSLLTLGIYYFVWYYMINKEIKLHDSNQQFSPGLAAFALFIPIVNLVSLYNTANRIKIMQKSDSLDDLISPGAALVWALLFGIGYPIYIQGTLNNHWHEHNLKINQVHVAHSGEIPVLNTVSIPASKEQISGWQILGISGPLAGNAIDLSSTPIVIGRDPNQSNVIIPSSSSRISRRHCIIRFSSVNRNIFLEDCGSKNGTFLYNGTKLTPGIPYTINNCERFYLGTPDVLFELQQKQNNWI